MKKLFPPEDPVFYPTDIRLDYHLSNHDEILARAYLIKGDLDKGISVYERMTAFSPDSRNRRFIYPRNYCRLAKLYEQKGLKAKALEHYGKFLDLWKNADTGLAEVADAKKRLASLGK